MGYESDFITGRSIGETDAAVAIVIIPETDGYPDPIAAAATAPCYPHDRFVPISLLLDGKIDDRGFFTPNPSVTLETFLDVVQLPDWGAFRDTVLNENDASVSLKGCREPVVPGLAIMHKSSADNLISTARDALHSKEAARKAAAITVDARKRLKGGDPLYFRVSEMGSPAGRHYTTLTGEVIEVPTVSSALSDGQPSRPSPYLVDVLRSNSVGAEIDGAQKLEGIYEALADYQKFIYGLRLINRYLQPSTFTRNDNLVVTAKFSIATLHASLEGFSERPGFDPEMERMTEKLQDIAEKLRSALAMVEHELEHRNSRRPGY